MLAERRPDLVVRVHPNESLWCTYATDELVQLVAELVDSEAALGPTVELDSSDRTRPNEQRGGASPIEAIAIYIALKAADVALGDVAERILQRVLAFFKRTRVSDPRADPYHVTIYGPDGRVLKEILVDDGTWKPLPEDPPNA